MNNKETAAHCNELTPCCGYCIFFERDECTQSYGECLIGKSFYPDAGTFSTNSCDFFDHHRNYSKGTGGFPRMDPTRLLNNV